MTDGSKVHKKLDYRYQSDYKRMCEGEHSAEDIARSLVQKLTKDVKDYGPLPVSLLRTIDVMLETAAEERLFMSSQDWVNFGLWIDGAVRQTYSKHAQEGKNKSRVGIEAAKRASEQLLLDTRRGRPFVLGKMLQSLVQQYVSNIYRINFADKVPLNPQHYRNADPEVVKERLSNITPHVMRQVPALARQILDEGRDIHTIRTPSRSTPRPGVDVDTEIAV